MTEETKEIQLDAKDLLRMRQTYMNYLNAERTWQDAQNLILSSYLLELGNRRAELKTINFQTGKVMINISEEKKNE